MRSAIRHILMVIVAFSGFTSLNARPAHALIDNYIFGYSAMGTGSQDLVIDTTTGTYTIQASSSGWYNNVGTASNNVSSNSDYIAGVCTSCIPGATTYQDYFSFNLTGVTGTVTGASLSLYNPGINNDSGNGYFGNPNNYLVYNANSDASNLLSNTNSVSTYNAMTTGALLGTQLVSTAANNGGNGSNVIVNLTPASFAALTSGEGHSFTIAGRLNTTPLPAGLPMFAAAICGLFGLAQIRKQRLAA